MCTLATLLHSSLHGLAALVLSLGLGQQGQAFALSAAQTADAMPSPAEHVGPAAFTENCGQWPTGIRFVREQPGSVVRAECDAIGIQELSSDDPRSGTYVRFVFDGASGSASIEGVQPVPGIHNFFLGRDSSKWVHDVPSFESVRYHGIYPGIDIVLRPTATGVKYDVIVDAGADLGAVRLRCEGARALSVSVSGDLIVETALGTIVQAPGRTFEIVEPGRTRDVACIWQQVGVDTFSLSAPDRDVSRPLIIDPDLLWSTYLGGGVGTGSTSGSLLKAVACDPVTGDVVVAGYTDAIDFPQTPGAYQHMQGVWSYLTLTKFSAATGSPVFSSLFGGTATAQNSQKPFAVAVGRNHNISVTGNTTAADFPVTPGAFDPIQGTYPGGVTGFVTQFSARGNALVFSTYIGSTPYGALMSSIAVDAADGVIVSGWASDPNFPTTLGAYQPLMNGSGDPFLACIAPDGRSLRWSTYFGASQVDVITNIALGPNGEVVAVGRTNSHDFPITPGAYQPTMAPLANMNLFVSALNSHGSQLLWSTYLGGTTQQEWDEASGIAVDALGAVYVACTTNTSTFPTTPGAFQTQFPVGHQAGILAKITGNGTTLAYSTLLAGPTTGGGVGALAIDPSGLLTCVSGGYSDFPTTPGAFSTSPIGGVDSTIVRLSPAGDRLFYSTFLGGPHISAFEGIALGPSGRVAVAGWCESPGGYPVTPNAFQPNFPGYPFSGIVTSIDLFLQGVEPASRSIPSCLGPLMMNATEMPVAGSTRFAVYCSAAPPNSAGLLIIGRPGGLPDLYRAQSVLRIPIQSDAAGYVETALPLPTGAAGQQFALQYVFRNPPGCAGLRSFSTSNAIKLTLQ